MKTYILDRLIITKFRRVLTLQSNENVRIVIPDVIVEEIKERSHDATDWQRLVKLIDAAEAKKSIIILPTKINKHIASEIDGKGFDKVDAALATLLKEEARMDPNTILVTEDGKLRSVCRRLGLKTMGLAEFKQEINNTKVSEVDVALQAEEKKLTSFAWWKLIGGILLSVLIVFIICILLYYLEWIVQNWDYPKTIIAGTVILSILVFAFRVHLRLGYGIAEFLAGVVVCCYILYPEFNLNYYFNGNTPKGLLAIPFLGAFFIMIRGLDNITTGITESVLFDGTWIKNIWIKVFTIKKEDNKG